MIVKGDLTGHHAVGLAAAGPLSGAHPSSCDVRHIDVPSQLDFPSQRRQADRAGSIEPRIVEAGSIESEPIAITETGVELKLRHS